jgi:hypothetical protein
MIWELALSCGLVVVGHARTLYRLSRVNGAVDVYEQRMAEYEGPLVKAVDRTDPEDIEAWHKAAKVDYEKEITAAFSTPRASRMIVLPPNRFNVTTYDMNNPPPITRRELEDMSHADLVRYGIIDGGPPAVYYNAINAMLTSHTCRACGMTSYNENDVRHSYCGRCHHFCKQSGETFT